MRAALRELDSQGFSLRRARGIWLVTAEGFERDALALGLLDATRLAQALDAAKPEGGGRGGSSVITLPASGARLQLRRMVRGGLLRHLRPRHPLGLRRSLAELAATARLRARGAPVPRPALLVARRANVGWEVALATVREEGCLDGLAFLRAGPSPERIERAARAAGEAVRRLHDAGGRHADLHAGNLLLRESTDGCNVIIVDLDRARVASEVGPARRMRELMRLARSLRKHALAARADEYGSAAFFDAYLGGDLELRRRMLRYLSRERARNALHVLGYRARAID